MSAIGLAADPIAVAVEALREPWLVPVQRRNTRCADLITSRIRVPGRQRIEDCLPLLCSLQSICSKGQAKPRSYGDQTVAPCGLKGRFGRGRGTPLWTSAGPPLGLGASHRIELQSNPQGSVKCARHRVAQIPATNADTIRYGCRLSPPRSSVRLSLTQFLLAAMRPGASTAVHASNGTVFDPVLFFPIAKRRT